MRPGDLYRLGDRLWEVEGVFLGAVGQESVAHITAIGLKESTVGGCIVPVKMLEQLTHYERGTADAILKGADDE